MELFNSFFEIKHAFETNPFPEDIALLPNKEREKYYEIIKTAFRSYRVEWEESYKTVFESIMDYIGIPEKEYPSGVDKEIKDVVFNSIDENVLYGISLLDNGYEIDNQNFFTFTEYLVQSNNNNKESQDRYEELFSKIFSKTKYPKDFLHIYCGNDFSYHQKKIEEGLKFSFVAYGFIRGNLYKRYPKETLEIYKKAVEHNYPVTELVERLEDMNLNYSLPIFLYLAEKDINAILNYCNGKTKLVYSIVEQSITTNNCDNPLFDQLFYSFRDRNNKIYFLDYLMYANDENSVSTEVLNAMFSENLVNDFEYDELFSRRVKNDPSLFEIYEGHTIDRDFLDFMQNDDYPIDDSFVDRLNLSFEKIIFKRKAYEIMYSTIFGKIIENNRNYASKYMGSNIKIYKTLIDEGYHLSKNQIITIILYCSDITEEEVTSLFADLNVKPFDRAAFREYPGDKLKLIDSFNIIDNFLNQLNINRDLFIQYAFASSYDWLDSMVSVATNNMSDFIRVKNYFFEKCFHINNHSIGVVDTKYMLETLRFFTSYPQLCLNLISEELTNEDELRIKMLLNYPNVIEGQKIETKEDVENIEDIIFSEYQKMVKDALESDDIEVLKDALSTLLFGVTEETIVNRLKKYGCVNDFRQLLFDNRNNKEIINQILDIMVYVSMMEEVFLCKDVDIIKNMLKKSFKNEETYSLCKQCNVMFQSFDERVNRLYAEELKCNITSLENVPQRLINKELSDKYGVEVIDLSNSMYCLIEHIKSEKESIESLVYGLASGDQVVISNVIGTNRNQRSYIVEDKMTFVCDYFLPELFVKSSISNLCSNYGIAKKYSYELGEESSVFPQIQRGTKETSAHGETDNSELLAFREGLKYRYLALFGDKEATEEEIATAKQYNLKFVKLQEHMKTVYNPKSINNEELVEDNCQIIPDNNLYNQLWEELHPSFKERNPRRIAIFADPHGLFEPTLAILADAKRRGVSEFYSLGDNIGFGPNPKEVMDLLEAYNVKSLLGNHEEYVINGVEKLKAHFDSLEAYDEARKNSDWTRAKLTKEQIERIKSFPEEMIVTIGGRKILLSHYLKSYDNKEEKEIPEDITAAFQGHEHFSSEHQEGDKIDTVKAVGFFSKTPTAHYILIEEKPDQGCYVYLMDVNYNRESTYHDIIESSMSAFDKERIEKWVGGKEL